MDDWQFNPQIDPMNSIPMGWHQSILPSSISSFPTDSGFIERAARFSCFNGANLGAFAANEPPMNDQTTRDSGEAEVRGDGGENSSSRGNGPKKRKRASEDIETDQARGASPSSAENTKDSLQRGEHKSSTSVANVRGNAKNPGKNSSKDSGDEDKRDIVHVRARRGQATNSHSLAERVRREKISERMKFLQDLVPGCSKVTGKAVMLDEIINYVQSLQRQVEFLSMKLAAVNPRLDFNIEGLLSKDLLHLRGGSSSALGNFSPEMMHLQLQQGLAQAGIPGTGNSADGLRRAINAQLASMNGFKEPLPQMPNAWEDELHNVIQMNFPADSPLNGKELSTKTRDGFPL